ncbi:MAG: peptide transporter [Anaerolineae bacterium]|nr:peptide transporter [Phycisphaerae bacterium]
MATSDAVSSRRHDEDAELREFRELMSPPTSWEDGFGIKAMLGGLFVGLIMTPASMYMSLVIGPYDMGPAAQWVTIILFIEVARRAFTTLTRPEIYVLYYMAGASLVSGSGLLWNQFIVQSETFRQFGLSNQIPAWVAPSSPEALATRSFFNPGWYAPIGLLVLGQFLQRVDNFGLGYVMYRLTSDVEKLPFPMAPVAAQGVTALADASSGKETWRWRVFSFGSMLGLAFALVYVALPTISGAFVRDAISFFPLPWKDLTPNTDTLLPAVPIILSFNLGLMLSGMVLPFWAMVGSFVGLLCCIIANPILHKTGILHNWAPGIGAVATINANTLDFYFSFGLGLTAAIAVIGIAHVTQNLMRGAREGGADWRDLFRPPPGRGDFSIWIALGIYVAVMTLTIVIAYFLLDAANKAGIGSPITRTLLGVFIFYGFVYTPIVSYVSARMEGLIGMSVQIPFVREATFILSGYQGAAIWFAPFPAHNYGAQTLYFRKTELTGTKITSMIKAELFVFPIVVIATIIFSQMIWRIAPVPSGTFQYANKMWEVEAYRQGLVYSSTLAGTGGTSAFAEAFKVQYLFAGLAIAVVSFAVLRKFGLPILLVYGLIRGLDQSTTEVILPQFIGALFGRYYFAKKFGPMWPQYRVVFFVGYSCGVGLIAMLSLGVVFIAKSVFQSPY